MKPKAEIKKEKIAGFNFIIIHKKVPLVKNIISQVKRQTDRKANI